MPAVQEEISENNIVADTNENDGGTTPKKHRRKHHRHKHSQLPVNPTESFEESFQPMLLSTNNDANAKTRPFSSVSHQRRERGRESEENRVETRSVSNAVFPSTTTTQKSDFTTTSVHQISSDSPTFGQTISTNDIDSKDQLHDSGAETATVSPASDATPRVQSADVLAAAEALLQNRPAAASSSEVAAAAAAGGGPSVPPSTGKRLLAMAMKPEWRVVDNTIARLEEIQQEHPYLKPDVERTVNAVDSETGITLLMYCVRESKTAYSQRLVALGALVDAVDNENRSALYYAATFGKEDIVRALLRAGARADVAGGEKRRLPLHQAAARQQGSHSIIYMLLSVGDPTFRLVQDADGLTPIWIAIENGNIAAVRELLAQLGEGQLSLQRNSSNSSSSHGDTVLHHVARKRNVEFLKYLLEHGGNVNQRNGDGQTLLHLATVLNDEAMMRVLHAHRADANIVDNYDRTPLHVATEKGLTKMIDILIEKFQSSFNARTEDGSTLAHIASLSGHPETALVFLDKGVPLHMPNESGAVCLHAAAKRGHVDVVRVLLERGANVDARTKSNLTALHLAVEFGQAGVVETLLGAGALVHIKGGSAGETPLHIAASRTEVNGEDCAIMLIKSGADVNATMDSGETPLHVAVRYGKLRMVEILLNKNADATAASNDGEIPLHIAVRFCFYHVAKVLLQFVTEERSRFDAVLSVNTPNIEGETSIHYAAEIVSEEDEADAFESGDDDDGVKMMHMLIIEYEGDIDVATKFTQETPLHYSARAGTRDIMLAILRHVAPSRIPTLVNRQARNGWSPLMIASEQGYLPCLSTLLEHHARIDVFDEHGKAALHVAVENDHIRCAERLLQHKAFVNAKSKIGMTPLHIAAVRGNAQMALMLVNNFGALVDPLTLAKRTPLHLAATNGQLAACEALLTCNADAGAIDIYGETPLGAAAEYDNSEIVNLFLTLRADMATLTSATDVYSDVVGLAAKNGSTAVIRQLMDFNKLSVITARMRPNDSTALHLAAANGHRQLVKLLLRAGASATDENADGNTPLHVAAQNGHVQILHTLKKAVPWELASVKTGLTALHVAAHYGQVEAVRELLTTIPASIKSTTPRVVPDFMRDIGKESGLTPLHLACHSGQEALVRLLLNYPGVQADEPTQVQGFIPLHFAAMKGHVNVVGLLLAKSTDQVHVVDKRGRTALHLAAIYGHHDMAALLLGQGAEINAMTGDQWTALHHAAQAGFLDVVKLLVESGADATLPTRDEKIALCYAAAQQHIQVLSFLMKRDGHDTYKLLDDKKFMSDLMACAKIHHQKPLEEFILLSPAPVDVACKMARMFRELSVKEKERAKDLIQASRFCELIATDLLAIAASRYDAGSILKALDHFGMPFLDVLIELEQKEVIAHSSVQRYLTDVWNNNLDWRSWKYVLLFLSFLACPPIWIAFSLPLGHRYNQVPSIKFMCHLAAHLYFIVLLILTVLRPGRLSNDVWPAWYEWLLLAFLAGNVVSEIRYSGGRRRQGLGWVRPLILLIAGVAIVLHCTAVPFAGGPVGNQLMYIRTQLFAISLLFSNIQILNYLSFHDLFGPMGIIIHDLMKDLLRFAVIFLLFLTGFTFTITAVYTPLEPTLPSARSGGGGEEGEEDLAERPSPLAIFEMLFFALYDATRPEPIPTPQTEPTYARTLLRIFFGTYMIVDFIVLINLLIAMMSDTYQRIQSQSDTEWKFGRAKLITNMDKTAVTPSPLNIFTETFDALRLKCAQHGSLLLLLNCFGICPRRRSGKTQHAMGVHGTVEGGQHFADVSSASRGVLTNVVHSRRNGSREHDNQPRSDAAAAMPSDSSLRKRKKISQVVPEVGGVGTVQTAGNLETVVDWQTVVARFHSVNMDNNILDLGNASGGGGVVADDLEPLIKR